MRMLGISPSFNIINKVLVNESEIHIFHNVVL